MTVPFISLGRLSPNRLEKFVATQREQTVTYDGPVVPTPGFRFTRTLKPLGDGPNVFDRAVSGLEAWAVYPSWLTLYPAQPPLKIGTDVALITGLGLLKTVSAVRVVSLERDNAHAAFTLGTLPQHAVSGGERFCVYRDEQGRVWYELTAVSKPQQPLVKLGAPVLRLVQAQFARDSLRSLQRFIASSRPDEATH